MPVRGTLRSSAAGLAALVVCAVPAGCAPAAFPSPTPATPTPVASTRLHWQPCAFGTCATLAVPVDHDDPAAGTLELAVVRVPASEQPSLGAVFVNPGGPGGSGRSFAAAFDRTGLERYDIVGWDPRGVGGSAPVSCTDGAGTDAYLALDNSPDDQAEVDALLAGSRAYAEACRERSGVLLDHLSVQDTARDLDLLRAAVGEERLTYYGASYGTAIGAAYAALFGERVGRMVLDAGVEPRRSPGVPQAAGFEDALARLGPDGEARVTALLDGLDSKPLAVEDRVLTQTLATAGLVTLLGGGEGTRAALLAAVAAAEAGDGSGLLGAADAANGRRPDGSYSGLVAAFTATYCADDDVRTPALARERWAAERAAAPVFGSAMGAPWLCVGWTAAPAEPLPLPAAPGGTVVVLGERGDPVTPYAWSQALAADLGATLLTTPGTGHVAYGRGSTCVDAAVRGVLTGDGPPPASCP